MQPQIELHLIPKALKVCKCNFAVSSGLRSLSAQSLLHSQIFIFAECETNFSTPVYN